MRCSLFCMLFVSVVGIFVGYGCSRSENTLILATTTSTENSGLLEYILPEFTKEHGVKVSVIAVGTGKAIKHGENGDVDIILVHARAAENEFVNRGFGLNRRDVMYNDFVIVGPKNDPAKVRECVSGGDGLERIAQAEKTFVSRGDDSGTHKKEKTLWGNVGRSPLGRWYHSAGQGMGAVLMIADEKQGYALVDRGTFIAYRQKVKLEIVCEGHKELGNPYGIIAVNPKRHSHTKYKQALLLIDWMTSSKGQALINSFKKNGEQLFYGNGR